jgi:hypothetical protein
MLFAAVHESGIGPEADIAPTAHNDFFTTKRLPTYGAKQTAMYKQTRPDGQNVVGRLDATV